MLFVAFTNCGTCGSGLPGFQELLIVTSTAKCLAETSSSLIRWATFLSFFGPSSGLPSLSANDRHRPKEP